MIRAVEEVETPPQWRRWRHHHQHTAPPSLLSYFGTGKCVKASTSVLVINTQSALETAPENSARCLSKTLKKDLDFVAIEGGKGGGADQATR